MRQWRPIPASSRWVVVLTVFALLVAPAAGFDLQAEAGSTDPTCCCAPEERPAASCCDETEPARPVEALVFAADMDCACQAPSPPAPPHPAPAPHGASAELSWELGLRVHLAAATPSASALDRPVRHGLGALAPPPSAGTEERSLLHRRSVRGTSVVLAVLSVARI